MKTSSRKRIEKLCIVGIIIAVLVFAVVAIMLLKEQKKVNDNALKTVVDTEDSAEKEEALADEMIYYPSQIQINETVPELTFYDENGAEIKISDFRGKNVILLFWTSWCKYCKEEFQNMQEYSKLLEGYDDVEFILLNKLDGEKETKEQALTFLKENNIPFTTYFDENLTIFNQLGTKIVPTMLGIDSEGVLKICNPGNIGSADNLAAMIQYVRNGGASETEKFITKELTAEGGVHVNYMETDGESPAGFDVLSESQGIMMEYAVLKEDKELFDRYLDYVLQNMLMPNSLAGWMVTKEEGAAKTNALVDDLRIFKAVYQANQRWGGYDELVKRWGVNILEYNTSNKHLVDHYDSKAKKKAKRITICFLDLEAIELLNTVENSNWDLYEQSYQLVEGGFISNDFPLYYSWYDYKEKEYVKDNLNMAEAMHTLLNLARVGELKDETIAWLEKSLENGGIKARYTTAGEIVEDYNYESTAIYAMVAMIGEEIGNAKMVTKAVARMESMRVNDSSLKWNGAFTAAEGKDIFSFDQCMALLAYGYLELKK
ncbi:MAG: TlpA family protein disulfide reductase [Mobilitalea sp.]